MRLLTLLIALILCTSALLTGCDQELRQPIMQVVTPSEKFFRKCTGSDEKSQ